MDIIKVMIMNEDMEERFSIDNMLGSVEYIAMATEPDNLEDAMKIIDTENVDVVLISSEYAGNGYEIAEIVNAEYLDKAIVIIEEGIEEETMHKALFSGAKDVVIKPLEPSKLVDSIYRSYELVKKRTEIHRETPVRKKRVNTSGRVFTVFSSKGGVGKTFVSINLAIALAQKTKKRVALVDLDLDFGSAALALNLQPRYTLSDVINDIRNLDADLMESYLLTHSSGISVLPASIEPQSNEFINAEHIQIILKTLQGSFDFIVVDMPARFYEPVNPAFVFAEKLLMVATPEVSTVRNVKGALMTLTELNYPKSKVHIIVNRMDSKGEIKIKDVELTLNQSVIAYLEADYLRVMSSMNQGIPYYTTYKRKPISKSLDRLVDKLTNEKLQQ